MAMYQSEYTQFINQFLEKNPKVDSERRELRLTWWDKKVDFEELRRAKQDRVRQKPYVYQPE